ncbi:MAG: hypothetical protein IK100_09640 [Muribaculaceae bacterium]|nr:hypothetical protein [Muribaculaceae bacterium]
MTTTAITTEQRLQDAAQAIYDSLSPVESEGIGWFIDTFKDGTQILKFHNALDLWGGSQLERVSSVCRDNGLLWWLSTTHFISGEYAGAKVTLSISLPES